MARKNLTADNTTNKIYASGNVSALAGGKTAADTIGRPGVSPVKPTTLSTADKSADKYYANGGSNRLRTGTKPLPATSKVLKNSKSPQRLAAGELVVRQLQDVPGVLQAAIDKLRSTSAVVVVMVANSDLLKRFRTAMDMAVTREELSSDEYHSVTLQFLGETETTPVAVVSDVPEDPLDFLKPEVTTPTEVETTEVEKQQLKDVVEPVNEEQVVDTSNEEEDEDATPVIQPMADVFAPTPSVDEPAAEVPVETPVETPAEASETPTPSRKKRR